VFHAPLGVGSQLNVPSPRRSRKAYITSFAARCAGPYSAITSSNLQVQSTRNSVVRGQADLITLSELGYTYDESSWPVVQFRFTGRLDAIESVRYFRDADALLLAPPGFTCVMDGVAMQMPEVELVRQQAKWLKTNSAQVRRINRGFAFVAPSAVIRGMVRAVLHIQPLPVPHAVFTDLDEGMAWAEDRATVLRLSKFPRR
jgi:hypothetical protein